jgi:hypothetical protein
MSTMSPLLPLMPKVLLGVSACFARSFVSVLHRGEHGHIADTAVPIQVQTQLAG